MYNIRLGTTISYTSKSMSLLKRLRCFNCKKTVKEYTEYKCLIGNK